MISLYVIGIVVGIIMTLIFKNTKYKGSSMPFVMELPNYRFPTPKSVLLLMKDKAMDFIQRAFTVIFFATIIIWFLQTFDMRLNIASSAENSLLAMVGKVIAPLFTPLGFSDWRVATSLITGFTAKEAVVSTMGVLTGTGVSNLTQTLPSLFGGTASVISFLVFTLLYTPCVAAVAAIKRELNSSLKAVLITVYQCVVAWIVAFIFYQLINGVNTRYTSYCFYLLSGYRLFVSYNRKCFHKRFC